MDLYNLSISMLAGFWSFFALTLVEADEALPVGLLITLVVYIVLEALREE